MHAFDWYRSGTEDARGRFFFILGRALPRRDFALAKKRLNAFISTITGRLHEKCLSILAGADIQFRRHNGLDVCLQVVVNDPIAFLNECTPSWKPRCRINVEKFYGWGSTGKCALQIQVPESGSIKIVDDLAGKCVVTSFEVLAGEYFDAIDTRLELSGDRRTEYLLVKKIWFSQFAIEMGSSWDSSQQSRKFFQEEHH
ncbi:hypothetical protein R3P38DRAFT_3044488 [Favolaschia claudopus]|uniref:Uncharacterized protein n=1 Tax=Favolaschia claudopus TaxID=2862362 RepID=A0AAW0A863_9AGAR